VIDLAAVDACETVDDLFSLLKEFEVFAADDKPEISGD
jgi:hypothetical protein